MDVDSAWATDGLLLLDEEDEIIEEEQQTRKEGKTGAKPQRLRKRVMVPLKLEGEEEEKKVEQPKKQRRSKKKQEAEERKDGEEELPKKPSLHKQFLSLATNADEVLKSERGTKKKAKEKLGGKEEEDEEEEEEEEETSSSVSEGDLGNVYRVKRNKSVVVRKTVRLSRRARQEWDVESNQEEKQEGKEGKEKKVLWVPTERRDVRGHGPSLAQLGIPVRVARVPAPPLSPLASCVFGKPLAPTPSSSSSSSNAACVVVDGTSPSETTASPALPPKTRPPPDSLDAIFT